METYKYELEPSVLQNMTENPKNEKYFTRISGTENMTSIQEAPVIASKGHYYQVNEEYANKSLPYIYAQDGSKIEPSQDQDDTYLFFEPWSGVAVSAHQKLLISFVVDKVHVD